MTISLTTKERYLLEDQKNHEAICIEKYNNYANLAQDPQLKALFSNHAKIEQEHYNTIQQLLNGQVPSLGNQQGGANNQQVQQPQVSNSFQPQVNTPNYSTTDKDLCTDMLMTEKYVSSTYNTAIFEFKDTQVRDVLNHIQKEEQKHGEAIFKYMESKGMYQVQ
ncbi:MAG: spore coat protein [Clostridiales bacterium]|uniref:spore coat protein n=1 Tax=Clostridium sp. N3C TaxID=1776758 RepID=UPI00092E0915|nr:spore coat protein [Clostridium sp. N3C]NLZ49852.1 spore coat protein [Clostridiales bacterium]SCN23242.1 Spore coat protein [Clostridium sp. N3C]